MAGIEKYFNASLEEMKKGFTMDNGRYECLICGKKTEKGIIYQDDGTFYDAERYMSLHIEKAHGSIFDFLISQDKETTGLSDHQNKLLRLFYQGKSDDEIQKEIGAGSSSTVRNHRFAFRERERQARIYLVLMELMKERTRKPVGLIPPHKSATMVDDRYKITEDENAEILKKYFPEGPDGRLSTFSMKEKKKVIVLGHIVRRFQAGRIYTEKEVNQVLKGVYEDFATIRRYLIEYGFMGRKQDGSQYWLIADNSAGVEDMDRKKELMQQYKEMKTEAGVYQIKNTKNNKALILSTPNLKTINGRRFELQMGSYSNKGLQEDWNTYGEAAFEFKVLEVLEEMEDGSYDIRDELKKLEEKWLERLQPFGDRGYNSKKKG